MSTLEKLLIMCTALYCITSSGCMSMSVYHPERARASEAESRSSIQPENAYEVPWRLVIIDEAPEYMIIKTTVFDPESTVSSTEWERLQYPFKGGILCSHMIKEAKKSGITSVLDVFYDLYFIFQDGTVAEKHFSPVDVEEYSGRYIDIFPQPRQIPSNQLRELLNTPMANPEADALYEEALQLEKNSRVLFGKNKDKLREALDKYDRLIKDYPTSDKIDDAAFKAGLICEYFQDYSIALLYYKRAYGWDPDTIHPARFRSARILDKRLHRNAEALELYREAIKTEGKYVKHKLWKEYAKGRIKALSRRY